jgi:hypothetical protein
VIAKLDSFGLDKDEFDLIMEWGEKYLPEEMRYGALVKTSTKTKLTRASVDCTSER